MPVDSVGPLLRRERFNPLAAGTGTRRDFAYNTTYTVAQTQSAWHNAADYGFSAGPVFVRNTTSIDMSRYRIGSRTSLRQQRNTSTELGWRFSPDLSLGGRVNVDRFDSSDPGSANNIGETKNEYQVSMRSKQKPMTGLNSEFNFFSGLLDLRNPSLEKHGVSGNLTSRVRHTIGNWLVQEVNGTFDGNLSRTRVPTSLNQQDTRDYSENARATISMFQNSHVGLRGNASLRHVLVETPADTISIRRVLSDNSSADATVRLKIDNQRYVDLTQKMAIAKQATVIGVNSRNTRRDDGFSAAASYAIWGCAVDAHFSNSFANSTFPTRSDSGGYGEFLHGRSLDGSLSRPLTSRVVARVSASIGLTSYRYFLIGRYPTPPTSRDQWHQSWRVSGIYTASTQFNTGVTLDVSKNRLINISSASAGVNSNVRTYRAEWNWSYRLLPGLTATQANAISADYTEYPFLPQNNRLSLNFGSATQLNAVITPRLSVTVAHSSQQSPGGNYILYPDGLHYFGRADETKNYTLNTRIDYSPSRGISLTANPIYYASDRTGTVDGQTVPQRRSRSLTFSGGANINWQVGRRGVVSGNIQRSYRADRSVSYSSGVVQPSPRSEIDYWNGSLQFSWTL